MSTENMDKNEWFWVDVSVYESVPFALGHFVIQSVHMQTMLIDAVPLIGRR
jgi:hypothetical protein